jgi:lysophospholipase L1-like esterase
MLIGTNNLSGTAHARANTPPEIVEGIAAIREELRARSPESHLMLMAILPRGFQAGDRFRQPVAETNRLLKQRFAADGGVTILDIGPKFLTSDGTLPRELMPDGTHPSEAGYQIWADALRQAGIQ